jgi:hypothetical protein
MDKEDLIDLWMRILQHLDPTFEYAMTSDKIGSWQP